MKIVKKINGEFENMGSVDSIENLDNCVMIELERGDKMKKLAKGANVVYNRKNTYSVKGLKEAIKANEAKAAAKAAKAAEFSPCDCCGETVPVSTLNEYGFCLECDINRF